MLVPKDGTGCLIFARFPKIIRDSCWYEYHLISRVLSDADKSFIMVSDKQVYLPESQNAKKTETNLQNCAGLSAVIPHSEVNEGIQMIR